MWQDEESSHMISVNIPPVWFEKKIHSPLVLSYFTLLQNLFEFGTRGPNGPMQQQRTIRNNFVMHMTLTSAA